MGYLKNIPKINKGWKECIEFHQTDHADLQVSPQPILIRSVYVLNYFQFPYRDPPVSKEFAQNLLENLQTERQMLELKFQEKTTTGVSVAEISYRFDISSVGEDSSVPIKPVLILDLLLSNGKRITFRCPWSMYHRLRFATARLLKEIQFLETRQIIIR